MIRTATNPTGCGIRQTEADGIGDFSIAREDVMLSARTDTNKKSNPCGDNQTVKFRTVFGPIVKNLVYVAEG